MKLTRGNLREMAADLHTCLAARRLFLVALIAVLAGGYVALA